MIEKRPFGRTGHLSTVTLWGSGAQSRYPGRGGSCARHPPQNGVNHIDVAARYGDAELRIGPWMAQHRQDFFLATKTGKRLYQDAREEIHRSLERLRVDAVDLLQLHALFHPDDWDLALGPGAKRRLSTGAGSRAIHRGHRTWLDDCRHA